MTSDTITACASVLVYKNTLVSCLHVKHGTKAVTYSYIYRHSSLPSVAVGVFVSVVAVGVFVSVVAVGVFVSVIVACGCTYCSSC